MARILLIDDQLMFRVLLTRMLEKAGHEVFAVEDAEEGVLFYRSSRTDLVITDFYMPVHDGLWVLAELRQLDPEVRVIVISSTAQGEAPLRHGARACLIKPVTARALEACVTEVLGRSVPEFLPAPEPRRKRKPAPRPPDTPGLELELRPPAAP